MRRFITGAVKDEDKPAVSEEILKFSRLLDAIVPSELLLHELIDFTISSRDSHDLLPSTLPVVRSIERSDAPSADKTAAITELWSLRHKIREAANSPRQYAVHLLWPPQSNESELLDLIATRFERS